MSSPATSTGTPAPGGRDLLRSTAPLITIGATWAARKGMMKGYEARTGKPAPLIRSREATVLQKILWAAAMAGVIALVEVVVWRMIDDEE
jgi:hypothetical protein